MPIYEYRCTGCGHEFETIQKISDAPLTECPACERHALVKKVSKAAFRLKGGGWYETDFKSENKRNLTGTGEAAGASDGGTGAGEGGEKADVKADSGKTAKPEAPAESKSKEAKRVESKPSGESGKAGTTS